MALIQTIHAPAESIEVGDCIITPLKTIEKVAGSYKNGTGWTIVTAQKNIQTSHVNEIVAVVKLSIHAEVTAGRLNELDLIWLEEDWWSVRNITPNSESSRKVDIELMRLNDTLETREVSVGVTKKFLILDK